MPKETSDKDKAALKLLKARAKRTDKHEAALELLKKRATRTDREQLDKLDELLGAGKGAKKERARLNTRIRKGVKS